MIVNRSVWTMTGQAWPVLAGAASLDLLEYDDAPLPAPETDDEDDADA